MAIDYKQLLFKYGVPTHSFFYYQDRGRVMITQVTAQTKRNILKDQARAKRKNLSHRDDPSSESNVVPLWAYQECDGPQTYEQFLATKFKSTALANEVLNLIRNGARPGPPPRPAPIPQNIKLPDPEPFQVTERGGTNPLNPATDILPGEESEEGNEHLQGMRMQELRAYAIQQGLPTDEVGAYRGNKGKQELIQRLTGN